MAIKLKSKPRAIVRPEFWDALRLYTDEMGLSVVKKIRGAKNERHAAKLAKEYARLLENMKAVRNRDPELETTLIHSSWDELTSNSLGELVFNKKQVIMRPTRYMDQAQFPVWDTGAYSCVVARNAFSISSPNPNAIEFRPIIDLEKFPELAGRGRPFHPHQSAHTCWGSYTVWVTSALKKFNVADLQDAMWKFVSHYTPRDTLAGADLSSFPWYVEVPREINN